MNLFVDRLDTVSERDVAEFLGLHRPETQRMSEGSRLDFSEQIPDDIGEDVASFANASGGLIFIGVSSDKRKQNIPIGLPGLAQSADLETQVSSKIDASVRPRPEFEIKAVKTANDTFIIVVRVRKGSYPPYEYQRGDRVRIPLRVHDHKRTATLRDIEGLLRERTEAARDVDSKVLQYVNSPDFQAKKTNVINGQKSEIVDENYHRIVIVPRANALLRLDRSFEFEFEKLVFKHFPHESRVASEDRRGDYFQIETRNDHSQCHWHHLWRIYRTGALGYTGSLVGDFAEGKPIGDLCSDLLSMCAIAGSVFPEFGILGDVCVGQLIQAVSAKFLPKFPAPSFLGDYDRVAGVNIPEAGVRSTNRAFSFAWLDTSELTAPDAQIADLIMYNLRELKGARFNYQNLLEAISQLRTKIENRLAQTRNA